MTFDVSQWLVEQCKCKNKAILLDTGLQAAAQ